MRQKNGSSPGSGVAPANSSVAFIILNPSNRTFMRLSMSPPLRIKLPGLSLRKNRYVQRASPSALVADQRNKTKPAALVLHCKKFWIWIAS
jgi:hypothetical protein